MSRARDRLYDTAFFLVETFAALEVTAVLVSNARITETLGLPEIYSSYILNSYLYPLFGLLLLALVFVRRIDRRFPPLPFFVTGLLLFAIGNVACFLSIGPMSFFSGRIIMGIGGAVAFLGQLWTACVFHGSRITQPLVWGESGAALGVVLGPLVGALFTSLAPEGWRWFFLLNAALGTLTALMALLSLTGLKRGKLATEAGQTAADASPGLAYRMTALQVAISMLAVGGEYLFSDFLQAKAGKSAMFVGWMTTIASAGAIVGSVAATRFEGALRRLPNFALAGLLAATTTVGICLALGQFAASSVPIFIIGFCMGMANVSIYAVIVQSSRGSEFLPRSLIYLIGMQVGNAIGVQTVGLTEAWHLGAIATAGTVSLAALIIAGVSLTVFGRADLRSRIR